MVPKISNGITKQSSELSYQSIEFCLCGVLGSQAKTRQSIYGLMCHPWKPKTYLDICAK